ncbi:hypothetical protein [Aporhodopirellula aestuarii]|uniref:Uncharacterized protein n=1 Tax=Aporhodopirellula aestuarii TaxID=2950107 RepID=A0ABT0UDJ4_9BACT|nr:hypothetical protein [Aporhodopirellula aestuarii]MCM2374985.1 hypothetical protein [Aporhodopirellula aestuarii]
MSNTNIHGAEPWVKIEEDWELKLFQPDPLSNSPQLNIYLTPDSTHPESYFQLQLNHAAEAGFSAGGLRVSAVENDSPVSEARSLTGALLTHDGDVIRWTSVLMVRNGDFYFAIKNGTSKSWGEFGGPEYLLQVPAGEVQNLSKYSPRQSIGDVDIGFGRNRVKSLSIRRIRAYREDGTFVTIETTLDAS